MKLLFGKYVVSRIIGGGNKSLAFSRSFTSGVDAETLNADSRLVLIRLPGKPAVMKSAGVQISCVV